MSDTFDDFEKDTKEKEEIINNLKEEVSTLKGRVETLEKESDDKEQHLRRNCILVHGLEKNKDEITDDFVASFIKDKMDLELSVRKAKPKKEKTNNRYIFSLQRSAKSFLKQEKIKRLWSIYYGELNCASDGGA